MVKIYRLSLLAAFLFSGTLFAQNKVVLGAPCQNNNNNQKPGPLAVQNGTGFIATSYTTTACGLNYTQASVRLNKRNFSGMTPPQGVSQPATYSISGIPSCFVIVKAFLYASVSANSAVPVTATITNPAAATASYSMSVIGTHIDKCWGYSATFSYRADVTSIISGNGNYSISGIPTSSLGGQPDADGATLFIIYRDLSQNYTGSIVLGDGCYVAQGGVTASTLTGFNVCGPVSFTDNFMLVGDLQQLGAAGIQFNSASVNYVYPQASQKVWDFIQSSSGPMVSGQTSAVFGVNNANDCFNFAMAGSYFRTSCNTCTSTPGFSVSTIATSTACTVGSATATPSGGTPPYTYTWTPTGSNSPTISGVPTGIYTVAVKDASCGIVTATVNIPGNPTISVNNATICSGSGPVTLLASGASTYSWNTGATTPQIIVSPSVTTVYTVTGSNGSCSSIKTATVFVNTTPTVNIVSSSSVICAGQSVTLTASGASTYSWSTGATSPTIVVTPSVTSSGNVYFVTGYNTPCANTKSISISVVPAPTVNVTASTMTLCSGGTATLYASGASTYTWSTGSNSSAIVVSPSVNTTYTVTGSNGGSCTSTKTITVYAGTAPTVNIVASSSVVCAGQSVTLTVSGASTYSWSTGSTSPTIVVTPSSTSSGNIYYVTGYNTPCSNTKSISISVVASPTVNVTSSTTTLCSGGSATLAASGASTYTWSTGANSSVIVVSPTVNTTYTVTGSNGGSCTNTKTISVAAGITPVISASTSNSFICAGQTVTLSATGASSYTYNPGGITGNPIALSPTANTTYTVLGTNGSCTGMTTITQSVSACTGVDKNKSNRVEYAVYPNPNHGEFVVIVPDNEGSELEVFNVIGQKVFTKTLTEDHTKVNLTGQSDGIYYVRIIKDGKTRFSSKIIKE
jgi:hypothetical protein